MTEYLNETGEPVEITYSDENGQPAVLVVGEGAVAVVEDPNSPQAEAIEESPLTPTET